MASSIGLRRFAHHHFARHRLDQAQALFALQFQHQVQPSAHEGQRHEEAEAVQELQHGPIQSGEVQEGVVEGGVHGDDSGQC
jgi:hypothetical protein